MPAQLTGPAGPDFPDMHALWAAQAAPYEAHLAGCGDAEYDRLILERAQTEAAYFEGCDRELARALEAAPDPAGSADYQARAEAERQAEAEAWGGRGPSASYAEWLAEGRQEADPAGEAERQAEYAAEWETEPEWDDADSAAYHARVEAGLEPEAGR